MKLFAALLMVIALSACSGKKKTDDGVLVGAKMPSFSLKLGDGKTVNTQNIPSGNPVVLFYYSTTCPHCREQLKIITDHMDMLKDLRFYMITNTTLEDMEAFDKEFNLAQYPNITLSLDERNFFPDTFHIQGVPYLAVYDKNKKLTNTFSGKVYSRDLLKSAQHSGIHFF